LTDIFAKNILHLPLVGNSIARVTQWITLCFIKTKFGKKISEGTSRSFPLGYFLIAEKLE